MTAGPDAPTAASAATTPATGFTTRPLDLECDVPLVHAWVTNERARFWGMQNASLDDVRREYAAIAASGHHRARIGSRDGTPVFLVETYDPHRHELAARTTLAPGDLGMHFLVAPPTGATERGFTRSVIEAVLAECFADPAVGRVVVEPDARNTAVHALNAAVGFEVEGEVRLSDKTALLSTCTRAAFEGRTRR
ncbi:acetyltransferase [Nocardioides sp. ChNu-153]|uniref:GNAT family N-acetyltransferase n=1 Tax=unclassified Nocardioides TaxID=2615069 RepID=UPI002405DC9F|nr:MULTISPECIES: GNAT family N-acetyltransferase [unclassified Nocardioides]MDF9715839.1 acetyltransferase [Nocardioides sp. ChNu-99]MDN7120781.1 acetyltransferase [Nocardioides sp. ChNu-153]